MIWKVSEQELPDFMSEWKKKHPSIKFEFKYSQTQIELLVLVYKDQNTMLQITIYRKQTNQQNYLDAWSEHSKFLKDSIPYSQALQIKRICSSQQQVTQRKWLINFRNLGIIDHYLNNKLIKLTWTAFETKKERHCNNCLFITRI